MLGFILEEYSFEDGRKVNLNPNHFDGQLFDEGVGRMSKNVHDDGVFGLSW